MPTQLLDTCRETTDRENTDQNGGFARPISASRDLSHYSPCGYSAGRHWSVSIAWYLTSLAVFETGWLPISAPKRLLLRLFGATVGRGVVIKPNVRIKFPWKLSIGEFSWIGQETWIDNLAPITIGSSVCVSQRAYLCTGSHDDTSCTFDLTTRPITLEEGCWIAANATVLGDVTVGRLATVCAGSVVTKDLPPNQRYAGVPARPLSTRS